jgi:hypothetical protein
LGYDEIDEWYTYTASGRDGYVEQFDDQCKRDGNGEQCDRHDGAYRATGFDGFGNIIISNQPFLDGLNGQRRGHWL